MTVHRQHRSATAKTHFGLGSPRKHWARQEHRAETDRVPPVAQTAWRPPRVSLLARKRRGRMSTQVRREPKKPVRKSATRTQLQLNFTPCSLLSYESAAGGCDDQQFVVHTTCCCGVCLLCVTLRSQITIAHGSVALWRALGNSCRDAAGTGLT